MTTQQHGTAVGVFSDQEAARRAIRALKDAGFTENEIGVAGPEGERRSVSDFEEDKGDESYAGEGALAGAATGAGIGALWGLGILAGALPAIGPAIAGGTLAVLLSSAAAGAAAAGLAGALIGMGVPKEEAEFYESEVKEGRTIITVRAGDRRMEAMNILQQHGGYDMASRPSTTGRTMPAAATTYRGTEASRMPATSGTTHGSQTPAGYGQTGTARAGRETAGTSLQAQEEKLYVSKSPVEAGDVTLRKEGHTEHKKFDIPVQREEIVVERHAGSGQSASGGMDAGQSVRVPVRDEQVNVEKEAVVAEEASIGKRKVQETQHVDENLRKENIKVEKHGDVNVREQRRP